MRAGGHAGAWRWRAGTFAVLGDLALDPGSRLHYDLGTPGAPGAGDLVTVAGNLHAETAARRQRARATATACRP